MSEGFIRSSNGPIRFVFAEGGAMRLGTTGDGYNHTGLKWWHSLDAYPWSYPQLIYKSSFGDQSYDYTLLRTDRQGNVLTTVDFTERAVSVTPSPRAAVAHNHAQEWVLYDMRGRKLASGSRALVNQTLHRGANAVVVARRNGGITLLNKTGKTSLSRP